MTVRQFRFREGIQLFAVAPDAPLDEAARRLRLHDVGVVSIGDEAETALLQDALTVRWAGLAA